MPKPQPSGERKAATGGSHMYVVVDGLVFRTRKAALEYRQGK